KESGKAEEILSRITHGQSLSVSSEYLKAMNEFMDEMRTAFHGHIIRRTLKSTDWEDNPISGLRPYREHLIIRSLFEFEEKALEDVKPGISCDNDDAAKEAGDLFIAKGKNFYLNIRKSLTHPACHSSADFLEGNLPISSKIDGLIKILKHHLAMDNMSPMKYDSNEKDLVPDNEKTVLDRAPESEPDKIVIYVAFPSNLPTLTEFLEAEGIKFFTYTGSNSMKVRSDTLKAFHKAGRDDPRVLIMSGAGAVGLNIAFANILIIMDTLWSAQEDAQLIGRVWRHPQPKLVEVYRLIAAGTPDVFLNNISFDKGYMHGSFANTSETLRKSPLP
ncbi:hypothetical protein WOLCODRAFT_84760, partial [Wolfiporia cocos MD-104 SS10]